MDQKEFDNLSTRDKIIVTTSGKLVKHFKGLEAATLLSKEETAKLIGCVRKLVSMTEKGLTSEK